MGKYCFISDKYTVRVTEGGVTRAEPVYVALVCDGSGNNKPLPPEIFAEWDGLGMGTNATKAYFVTFEFDALAHIEIAMQDATGMVTVKPQVEGFAFADGRTSVSVEQDRNFVIQPDGDIFGALHVFCHRRRRLVCDKAHLIEFTPGIHTVENSPHIVNDAHGNPVVAGIGDDTLIYLHKGAYVCADIVLRGVKNVRVAGTGVLSTIHRCHGADTDFAEGILWGAFRGNACPSLYIRSGCRDIVVEDITLNSEFRNIVIRNSSHISLKNVKMFSSTENADGINCYNTSHMVVDGCYIYSCDDCFCMYNACDSIPALFDEGYEPVVPVCRDVEVKNCLMCSASRPVVLGGHATGATDPRCIVENIHIHDCYIMETPKRLFVGTAEREMRWSGHLRILSQSEQLVRNLLFENIRIDYTHGCISKPFHIEVRGNMEASYTESQGYRIENITFRNIEIGGHTEDRLPIFIASREAQDDADLCGISVVAFENVTINNAPLDAAEMIVSGPVESIRVTN